MASEVGIAVANAWTRWQHYTELHHQGHELSIVEMETQFELVALGLALNDNQLNELFENDAAQFVTFLTPLPTLQDGSNALTRLLFQFVSAAVFMERYFESSHRSDESVTRLLPVVYPVLLPVLQFQHFSSLHHITLRIFQTLFQNERSETTRVELLRCLQEIFCPHDDEIKSTLSYDSLCRLLTMLVQLKVKEVETTAMAICLSATKRWKQEPAFLRAVVVHIVPDLIHVKNDRLTVKTQCQELLERVNNVYDDTTSPHELLYLIHVLIPKAPSTFLAETQLQTILCTCLRHQDTLVRKQALEILKRAFSFFPSSKSSEFFSTWQTFLAVSDVVQFHQEPHLLDQVWPQIIEILTTHFIVDQNDSKRKEKEEEEEEKPLELTFEWVQSLLLRLFTHENPATKRVFLSKFIDTCVAIWHDNDITDASISSYACSRAFQRFILDDFMRLCNDPALFKPTHRMQFQSRVTTFLALFLAFQVQVPNASEKTTISLDDYVLAMEAAIYGQDTGNHSPEALFSLLQVFESVPFHQTSPILTRLSAKGIHRLWVIFDVHVMPSYSQAIRSKMLRALTFALTNDFVNASDLPLSLIARIVGLFPIRTFVAEKGAIWSQMLTWLHCDKSSTILTQGISSALQSYVSKGNTEHGILTPIQLARLWLLLTAEINTDEIVTKVVVRTPLSEMLSKLGENERDDVRLVRLVAKLEEQVQEVVDICTLMSSQKITFSFERECVYTGEMSCHLLFQLAMDIIHCWLEKVSNKLQVEGVEKEDTAELVESAAFVLAQMNTHIMNTTGEWQELSQVDTLCEKLKTILTRAAEFSLFDVALVTKLLSIIGLNPALVDSLETFQSHRILPLLLTLDTSRRDSGIMEAKYAIHLGATKWQLLLSVMEASAFIDTQLLHSIFTVCVEALPTVGLNPLSLLHMVNVLSLVLSQVAVSIANELHGIETIINLLEILWTTYTDSKAKPDALTRAVIIAMFQPVFLSRAELNKTMKHWTAEFIRFGSRNRPNVIFHLTCRLCQIWRVHPSSALSFIDEFVQLLLYKEPVIDEKEQLTMNQEIMPGFYPISDGNQEPAITSSVKDRFVRLVLLNFLDNIALDAKTDTQKLMDALFTKLVQLNVSPEWQKQHMINSDGYGKKLRSWQALCVISAYITQSTFTILLSSLQTAFAVPQLPSVRYYMELFGMRLATKFPRDLCTGILLPMLRKPNLMPQVAASMMLVATYLIHHNLDEKNLNTEDGSLLETMFVWLNSSHGYTRVLTQYLVAKLLPRYLHQLPSAQNPAGLCFLQGTARFLSDNKECKRMLRRQARQLETFHPDYESSFLGILSSGFMNELGELLPRTEMLRFSEEFKDSMDKLYAQYQLENFTPHLSQESTTTGSRILSSATKTFPTVQRKIDTTALLLDDTDLPAEMRGNVDLSRHGESLNARERPRQPIIVCATLVDKIPNLAGLARTCEIFNAQKLIVPNLRQTEQDATFASVSATAHKWMPLAEIRPHGDALAQAIHCWKKEGYTIVAVEQTASSVSLTNYSLPKKVVVVLGREKEGIPVALLQLVDVCVEIPQFGLVRSLNVHVSGALVLWEYTRQQLMAGTLKSTLT